MRDAEVEIVQNRRNISTHSYSIKLSQNNFITFLYLYKSLNYELSSMRNNYLYFKNDARCRSRFAIIVIKKKIKRIIRNYRTLK